MTDKKFTPDWTNTPPVPGSYRSIVKEGLQGQVKVPTREYYEQIKRDLKLDDTLVEVPMAKMFLGLGMAKGPLLAYLLADPVISLPSILVVRKIMGTKRTLVYAVLITIFCSISGLLYGFVLGVF